MTVNSRGYILQEALIGIFILSFVVLSLYEIVSIFIIVQQEQNQDALMTQELYMMADALLIKAQEPFDTLSFEDPSVHTFTLQDEQLCIHYEGRSGYVKTSCVPQ